MHPNIWTATTVPITPKTWNYKPDLVYSSSVHLQGYVEASREYGISIDERVYTCLLYMLQGFEVCEEAERKHKLWKKNTMKDQKARATKVWFW
jgi:hypothetical protein